MPEFLRDHKAGLWIGGTGLVCLVVMLAFIAVRISDIQEAVYSENATNARHAAIEREFKKSCDNIIVLDELRHCFERVIGADWDTQRAQEDLKAQKDVARYALWMFDATVSVGILSLIVGLFGIYFVWRSLNETREIFTKENRAWVKIPTPEIIGKFSFKHIGAQGTIAINVKNVGKSPAFNVYIYTDVIYIGKDESAAWEKFFAGRKIAEEISDTVTQTLFPDDCIGENSIIVFYEREIEKAMRDPKPSGFPVIPMIVISVLYRVSGKNDIMETTIPFYVIGLDPMKRTIAPNTRVMRADIHGAVVT